MEASWSTRPDTPGCQLRGIRVAFLEVMADDLAIYAVTGDGSLLWYRDELRDGTNGPNAERGWAPGSGSRIGHGWADFRQVFSGGDGTIYAITESGALLWYRDQRRDGTNGPNAERGWAPGSGTRIGHGWADFRIVVGSGAGEGLIYAITGSGALLWYRDELRDGTNGPNAERGWGPGQRQPDRPRVAGHRACLLLRRRRWRPLRGEPDERPTVVPRRGTGRFQRAGRRTRLGARQRLRDRDRLGDRAPRSRMIRQAVGDDRGM